MTSEDTLWPVLETGYDDEFGSVDPEVHRAAGYRPGVETMTTTRRF